jgi:uncharacterized Tic20 family protein
MKEFDKKYKVYTWRNWMNVHWLINPGVAFSEFILGYRPPKILLEDKTSDKPRIERMYVPCPHCNTIHDSRTWAKKNGTFFKNWFGLYCPNCGNVIPCLLNSTSFLLLALTFPIWVWFKKRMRSNWLAHQPDRYQNLDVSYVSSSFKDYNWIKQGMIWALFMYVIMTFLFPLIISEPITLPTILIGIPIWALAGLGYGYFMKTFFYKRRNTALPDH